jgi:small RNA 2'-O-methyltransferase
MTTALHEARFAAVREVVRAAGAAAVLDLGCGEGAFLLELAMEPWAERVLGLDVSASALATLAKALEALPEHVQRKVELRCSSYTEPDPSLRGFDAAVMVETIEHIHPDRLSLVERAVFTVLAPPLVVVTTPNADFNALLGVPDHRRRPDHRFEWGRERFRRWADGVARRNGYSVDYHDLGGSHPMLGGPSQMAVFSAEVGAGQGA